MVNKMKHKLNNRISFVVLIALFTATLPAQAQDNIFEIKNDALADGATASFSIALKNGPIADYGATPWYTDAVRFGTTDMNLIFDTGTNLFWATTDDCITTACAAHTQVNTAQSAFSFITDPDYPKDVSFGPWGTMQVDYATVPISIAPEDEQVEDFMVFDLSNWDSAVLPDVGLPPGTGKAVDPISFQVKFDASINYIGSKFQYLTWGGGIGLPSESSSVEPGISDFFLELNRAIVTLSLPIVGFEMNSATGIGSITFGNLGPNAVSTQFTWLSPKKSSFEGLQYLWGTNLHAGRVGSKTLPNLTNAMFYLDTGSSRFKGGREFIEPILDELLAYTTSTGEPIFDTYTDNPESKFTGIKFANGKSPSDFADILPDFSIDIGQLCHGNPGSATITLSPENYSYQVEQGDRAGEWVVAFHVLDGVDGLLVGSVFMNGFSSAFQYNVSGTGDQTTYTQGEMYLFTNADSTAPKTYKSWTCNPSHTSIDLIFSD